MASEHSRAKSAMSGGGKKPTSKSKSKTKKHPHHLEIRHGKSGGHIVTHHFEPDENGVTPEPEDNVLPDKASLLQHISDNVPDQAAPQAPSPDMSQAGAAPAGPGAGAPPPAPAGPQPGM